MIKTKRARARDRARGLADNKLDKLAYSINDLQELGFGCRAYVYSEINAGRLRATKRWQPNKRIGPPRGSKRSPSPAGFMAV